MIGIFPKWRKERALRATEGNVAISYKTLSLRAQRGNLIFKGGFDESNPYSFSYEIASPLQGPQ